MVTEKIVPIESNWIELSTSEYERLDDVLKPYFYKVIQYKDGFLPEWKTTSIPGYHKDLEHETREVYKLAMPIKSTTGSEFGSKHWFNTLIARHLHMGEFLGDYIRVRP